MIDLDAQIKAALKSKDAVALNAYRSLKAKAMVKINEAGRGTQPLSEEELGALVKREVRERQEANEFLRPGDAKREENSRIMALLEGLLPKTLAGDALEALIRQKIAESGAQGAKDMGKVMASLKQSGQPVDMGAASVRVKALLSS